MWPPVSRTKTAYSVTASTSSRSWSVPAGSAADLMLDRAELLDLDPYPVAGLEEARRVEGEADAGRGPGEDQVAGLERDRLQQEAHERLDAEDQIRRARVLSQLAVDPRAQLQRLGALDPAELVGGGHPRPPWAEGVGALGPRPLRLAALQVARGDVVGDGEAGHRAARAHDDHELALVIEAPHDAGRAHGPVGRRARAGRLLEDDRRLRRRGALLGGMRGVVEPDAEDRPRPRHGREQAHVAQRPGLAVGGRLVARGELVEHRRAVGEGGHVVARDLAGEDRL